MKKKYRSVGVNAVLNTVKSGIAILFPLITYPYVFRILHAAGMGKINYSNSIISYFSMIAALGVSQYVIREGSKFRNDTDKLVRFASQLFSINIISTIISYIMLILCVLFVPQLKPYGTLILILSMTIGFTTLGVDWINPIFEDYLYITVRSIITHLISLILLFVIVRKEEDIYLYALITVATPAVVCIMNWYRCRKYLKIKFTFDMEVKKHIKPILLLFANSIATSIYVSADTTMLGIMSGDVAVGLYSIAVKIYGVVKKLLVAMYMVTIPRISYYWGQNDISGIKRVYTKMISNLLIILFPASIGLICVAKEVISFMGGSEYAESVITLQILSVALIGAVLGGAVTYCLNIPIGLEKINLKATICSAVINVVLNIFMLPVWKQNGAAFSTVVSEFFVLIYCIISNKRFIEFVDLPQIIKNTFHAFLGCASIVIISRIVHLEISNELMSVVIIIVLSCIVYLCELLLLKNELVYTIIGKFKSKSTH